MKSHKSDAPPKWADRFMELYCNPKLLEQIQGDIHELYYWRLDERGLKNAKNAFWWDVIRCCRWRNIKRSTTQYQQFNNSAMLKNYFKIGWRNLLNQKIPSLINIFGLATAIACCLVAYLFIEGVWLRGMYHENKDDIYMVTHTAEENGDIYQFGHLATPLAAVIKEDIPAVANMTRVNNSRVIININNENFAQRAQFVDPEYMEMFTYTILSGSKSALNDPYQIILTEQLSQKFFNTNFPIGQEIKLHIGGEQKTFTVGAVIKDLTRVSMFKFDMLINNYHLNKITSSLNEDWDKAAWTFVHLEEGANLAETITKTDRLVTIQNEINPDNKYLDLQLEPLMQLSRKAQEIQGGAANGPNLAPQIVLAAIGIFLLTLAIFNYINIAILMATRRIKEIGVRKVIGGRKSQLIFQFLSENLITCFLSIVLGGVIASTLFIPWFNEIATSNFKMDLINDQYLYYFLGGLLLFITLASGAYPAFYISSFKPVEIFSDKQRLGSKSKFTGILLTFQFVLAIITIVAGLAFVQTNSTNEGRDWGYNNSSKIVVNIPSEDKYHEIKNELIQQSKVIDLAGSMDRIGENIGEVNISLRGEEHQVDIIRGEANYPDLMGLRLSQGRLFDSDKPTDITNSIIVNSKFMEWYDLEFPVKDLITLDSNTYNIIGVVEDFHSEHFAYSINPTVIQAIPDSSVNYLTVKVAEGETEQMAGFIKNLWHEKYNNSIYDGRIQAEIFDTYFFEMKGLRNIMLFTATFAIILSAMGLFGLLSLNIGARMKDFSIRKVLGASILELSRPVLKRYLILWTLGSLIGGFLANMAISMLLDSVYAVHDGVGSLSMILAMAILLLVIVITIAFQLVKVKNTNPVDTLRVE